MLFKAQYEKQLDLFYFDYQIQSLSKSKYQDILDLQQFLQQKKEQQYDYLEFRKVGDRKIFTPSNKRLFLLLKIKPMMKIPQLLLIPYQLKDLLQVIPFGKQQNIIDKNTQIKFNFKNFQQCKGDEQQRFKRQITIHMNQYYVKDCFQILIYILY
ncbi:unnamed protein product [Paramecium octaurelia]|uniref:Uncharacterized protein n=1 Tax=Paramecium octaurelia TaxID=43137 RepID=A0A8S1ULK1_PAROT|nr:unnamed protein product [Paramecium octaurelia]